LKRSSNVLYSDEPLVGFLYVVLIAK